MLVLSRTSNEAIVVTVEGRRVRICVVEVKGPRVKLGIEAPREVEVHREEVQAERDRGVYRPQPENP